MDVNNFSVHSRTILHNLLHAGGRIVHRGNDQHRVSVELGLP